MTEPVALAALALDAALGWPDRLHRRTGHPVGGFARLIDACARAWNRPAASDAARRAAGVLTVGILLAASAGAALLFEHAARMLAGRRAWPLLALAAWPALAQRSLLQHYLTVLRALERGDLPSARIAVGRIVGRDTAMLDAPAIARAAIESLSESFCDGVIAPLFWLLLLGLPGVWAYKAINTADSLIGHREEPWRCFGWAAARSDDVLNWIPARLSGALVCLAGASGWRLLRRDHACHASPNAGWPEAAMAGALGVRLAGPVRYDGVLHEKPWIGDGPAPGIADMRRAAWIYARACALAWLVSAALISGGMACLA